MIRFLLLHGKKFVDGNDQYNILNNYMNKLKVVYQIIQI
jgi:hypothetical protein